MGKGKEEKCGGISSVPQKGGKGGRLRSGSFFEKEPAVPAKDGSNFGQWGRNQAHWPRARTIWRPGGGRSFYQRRKGLRRALKNFLSGGGEGKRGPYAGPGRRRGPSATVGKRRRTGDW